MDVDEYLSARTIPLRRLAWVLTRSQPEADDLVQSTMVDLLQNWERVVSADTPDAYARRVLINRFLRGRRRAWHREFPTEPEALHSMTTRHDGDDFAESLAQRDAMNRALERLSPRLRGVLVLRYFENLSDSQISDALGISEGAVRVAVSRGLGRLRIQLEQGVSEFR